MLSRWVVKFKNSIPLMPKKNVTSAHGRDQRPPCLQYGPRPGKVPPPKSPHWWCDISRGDKTKAKAWMQHSPVGRQRYSDKRWSWERVNSAVTQWWPACWHHDTNLDALTRAGIFLPLLDPKPPSSSSKMGVLSSPHPAFPSLILLCTIHYSSFTMRTGFLILSVQKKSIKNRY